jgi:hypothetical protein
MLTKAWDLSCAHADLKKEKKKERHSCGGTKQRKTKEMPHKTK